MNVARTDAKRGMAALFLENKQLDWKRRRAVFYKARKEFRFHQFSIKTADCPLSVLGSLRPLQTMIYMSHSTLGCFYRLHLTVVCRQWGHHQWRATACFFRTSTVWICIKLFSGDEGKGRTSWISLITEKGFPATNFVPFPILHRTSHFCDSTARGNFYMTPNFPRSKKNKWR